MSPLFQLQKRYLKGGKLQSKFVNFAVDASRHVMPYLSRSIKQESKLTDS